MERIVAEFSQHYGLNEQEAEVLRGWINGETYDETANRVFISRATVNYYAGRLLQKLGLHSRVEFPKRMLNWIEEETERVKETVPRQEKSATGTVRTSLLKPHPANQNYFRDVSGDDWGRLLLDISENGIRDPLKVTTDYTIIAGHQRLRAAKELGIDYVPVDVYDVSDAEAERLMLMDNLNRRQLTDMEKARLLKALKEMFGYQKGGDRRSGEGKLRSAKELADELDMGERTARLYLKLNDLIPELQQMVEGGRLSKSAAEQIAYLSPKVQEELCRQLMERMERLSIPEAKKWRKQLEESRGFREVIQSMRQQYDEQKMLVESETKDMAMRLREEENSVSRLREEQEELRQRLSHMEEEEKELLSEMEKAKTKAEQAAVKQDLLDHLDELKRKWEQRVSERAQLKKKADELTRELQQKMREKERTEGKEAKEQMIRRLLLDAISRTHANIQRLETELTEDIRFRPAVQEALSIGVRELETALTHLLHLRGERPSRAAK